MENHQIKVSYVVLFVSGLGLLLSAYFLQDENIAPWIAFQLFFFLGLILLFLKR